MQKPHHIAIIMDGNGRWAESRGLPRMEGHKAGAEAANRAIDACIVEDIPVLTLFAFGQENWKRPETEVEFLMGLFVRGLENNIDVLLEKNIKLRFMGDMSSLSPKLQGLINKAEKISANNTGLQLNMAINYSGRWDITQACQKIASSVKRGYLQPDIIDERLVNHYMALGDLPAPDLFIRTSGEYRISNFMLWQFAYTELFFLDEFWPDFNKELLEQALQAFSKRERRYGKVDAYVES